MAEPSSTHATFTIERNYDASPARVFAALSEIEAKARWFIGPEGWTLVDRRLDFRVGGREHVKGKFPNGPVTVFDGYYHDIVKDRRIVFAYDMHLDERYISVSLATVDLFPAGKGTRLVFTEQAAFLDDYKDPDARGREQGTRAHLERLAKVLGERA
jgi:uncharacterized protein YndB with AHSA1/START domain